MTTEKKKRVQKPKKDAHISLLLATIPFLAGDPMTLSEEEVFDYATLVCTMATGKEGVFEISKEEFTEKEGPAIKQALCMTALALRGVHGLACQFASEEGKEVDDWLYESTRKANEHTYGVGKNWINVWSGEKWAGWSYPSVTVSYSLATALIQSFKANSNFPPLFRGVGFFYIGACPAPGCGKIFEKQQSNQELCSRACKQAVYRQRKENVTD